jgi:predicted nucleic acid-binding protein
MELYNGETRRFMVSGHESIEYRILCKTQAASKLYQAISALRFISIGMGMNSLTAEIEAAAKELHRSGELSEG